MTKLVLVGNRQGVSALSWARSAHQMPRAGREARPTRAHGLSAMRAFSSTSFLILGYCGNAAVTLWHTSMASTYRFAFR
jgi:hypothetical protein